MVLKCLYPVNNLKIALESYQQSRDSFRAILTILKVSVAVVQGIMHGIYTACKDAAKEYNTTLQAGANIAGFLKVAEAMTAQGM